MTSVWPSYVINLADNTARMENARAQLDAAGLPFRRIDAVNGWQLPSDEIARVYDAEANAKRARHDLVPAEIGCYLSHIDAWRAIASGDAAGGFIFEDDFEADTSLAATLQALTQDGGSDWDMVKLFTFSPDAKQLSERPLTDTIRLTIPYRVPTCLIGYGLTKQAAQRLADQALPFFRPVDEDQKYVWETGLRVALTLPAPIKVGDQQAVTGTIGNARRDASQGGLKRLWRGLRTQLAYQAKLRWHRARGAK
ncbi:glycosyltransferase family 25 protein [Gymnodinialimonas sp.]